MLNLIQFGKALTVFYYYSQARVWIENLELLQINTKCLSLSEIELK